MSISKITGASIEDGSITLADLGITTIDSGTGNTLTLQANSRTGITIDVTGNTAIANTLTFSSSNGARIRGDMSNDTVSSRLSFQTTTANSTTTLNMIPSGTGTGVRFDMFAASDSNNSAYMRIGHNGTVGYLSSSFYGSGTNTPLVMFTAGSERLRIDTSGNVGIGTNSPGANGFKFAVVSADGAITRMAGASYSLTFHSDPGVGGRIEAADPTGAVSYQPLITSGSIQIMRTGGSERMRIDAAGRLGIGTTSPSQLLHVAAGNILTSNTAGTIATVSIAGNGSTVGTSDFALQQGTSSEAYVYNRANSFLVLGTNNTERMRILANGNVGIGTTDIGYRLVVAGTAGAATISLLESGVRSWGVRAGGATTNTFDITDFNAGISRLLIDSNGFVGIGTSSPARRLDVRGSNTTIRVGGDTNDIGTVEFFETTGSTINASISSNRETAAAGGDLRFATKLFSGSLTERMRITAGGNVLIGTTSSGLSRFTVIGTPVDTNDGRAVAFIGDSSALASGIGADVIFGSTFQNDGAIAAVAFVGSRRENATSGNLANSLVFGTRGSGGNSTERMRIDSSGNLLIGRTSQSSGDWFVVAQGGYTATSQDNSVRSQLFAWTGLAGTGTFTNHDFTFRTNNTEKMRITNGGIVGIGLADPTTFSSGVAQTVIERTSAGNNTVPLALVNRSGTTNTSVSLDFNPNTNIALAQIRAFRTDASWGGGTDLRFLNYDGSALAERARITSTGAFMVGTSIAVNSTDNVHKIGDVASGTAYARLMMQERSGNWISFNDGAGTHYGTIARSGGGVSYGSNSDYRLKENIAPMTGALNKVVQLKPCTYTWKSTGKGGQGFIAHELQEVIPDAVSGEKDGINPETDTPAYQTVDTSFLVATLTAAIQEQQAIIESLKSRIEILEQK